MAEAGTAPLGSTSPHWRYVLRQCLWAGLDLLAPPRCCACRQPGARLCARCASAFPRIELPVCSACGWPIPSRPASGYSALCSACLAGPGNLAGLSGLRAFAYFDGPAQLALHALKYRRDVVLADTLARFLLEAWRVFGLPAGVVIPVPLSAERLAERGYNQAGLLARALAELARLPVRPAALRRVRHTRSQVGLSAAERQANVAGAFLAEPRDVRGAQILLIDDVCTTGATLAACAQALRAAGATEVWGLTLARARRPHLADSGPRPAPSALP